MCGRYTIRRYDVPRAMLEALRQFTFDEFDERPRFNIAPSQHVPMLVADGSGPALRSARWGFVPSWTRGKPKVQPINAKGEGLATSGMFRQAFRQRRCLLPADGFYEWKGDKPPKQPFFIHMADDAPFAFGGVWERWKPDPDAEPVETCAIITTAPNELMRTIHNRMPLIIDHADYPSWLDADAAFQDVEDLVRPFPAERMQAYRVTTTVNRPSVDGPECIEPADAK